MSADPRFLLVILDHTIHVTPEALHRCLVIRMTECFNSGIGSGQLTNPRCASTIETTLCYQRWTYNQKKLPRTMCREGLHMHLLGLNIIRMGRSL